MPAITLFQHLFKMPVPNQPEKPHLLHIDAHGEYCIGLFFFDAVDGPTRSLYYGMAIITEPNFADLNGPAPAYTHDGINHYKCKTTCRARARFPCAYCKN